MDNFSASTASQTKLVVKSESATDKEMEDQLGPASRLYRLADECARVIAEISNEAGTYSHDDVHSLIQDGFATMVSARVAAIQKAEVNLHERWPTESEDDYVNRVAQGEAGGFLEEQRQLIATMLCKVGSLPEEQIRLTSARTLVVMEKVDDRTSTESRYAYEHRWMMDLQGGKRGASHDDYVRDIARDEAGGVLAEKRQLLAAALTTLGTLTQEEIRHISTETLVLMEDAFAFVLYAQDFSREDVAKRWRPLVAYCESLARGDMTENKSISLEDDFWF